MSAVVDAIGVVSGIFTIIGFLQSNLPSSSPQGASVQIKAGLGDDDSSELGGEIKAVYGFDYSNNYLGQSGGGSMGDGGVITVTIDQSEPGVQSDYISVENGNNAVCIAWVSVKQFDDTAGGAWTGDIGANCGQSWYYGNQRAGTLADGKTEYRPLCAWFDGDHTNDIENAAMKFRVHAYGDEAQDTIGNGHQCDSTIYGTESGPINGAPARRSPGHRKPRLPWMENRLIVSNHTEQSAARLCEDENSWGPDMVGADGQFCDMGSKTLTPLCSTNAVDGCMELDAEAKHIKKRSSVARRETNMVHKSYGKISHWGEHAGN